MNNPNARGIAVDEGHQDGVEGYSCDEGSGAVDGIEDPGRLSGFSGHRLELLSENTVPRKAFENPFPEKKLRRAIRIGNRAVVFLVLDPGIPLSETEVRQRVPSSGNCDLDRKIEEAPVFHQCPLISL